MSADSFGIERLAREDAEFAGSRFSEVRKAIWANPVRSPIWRQVGTITFDEAVASFNGDRVVHFNHPPWRDDRNDPRTVTGLK